jgi:hypothetical protein
VEARVDQPQLHDYFNETRDDSSLGKTYSLEETDTETDLLTPYQFSIIAYGDNALGPTLPYLSHSQNSPTLPSPNPMMAPKSILIYVRQPVETLSKFSFATNVFMNRHCDQRVRPAG